jgi:hypothetical protein
VRARRESLTGDLGQHCASGKKGRRGRTEKLTGGDRLLDREKGGGAAQAGAEGAGPGWLLARWEKREKGKREVGRAGKEAGPRGRRKGWMGYGLGEREKEGWAAGCNTLR